MKKIIVIVSVLMLAVIEMFSQPVLSNAGAENEFSLVYELNGGTNASSNKDSYLENAIVNLGAPTRSGYKFAGWYWDEAFTNPIEGNTFKNKKGALKIYAKWIKKLDLTTFEKENMVEIVPSGKKVTLENFAGTDGVQDIFGYAISKYEVTQELYMAIMGINPSYDKGDQNPVERVTWYDAVYFCNELTKLTMGEKNCCYTIKSIRKNDNGNIVEADVTWNQSKKGYRLPTETEWEMAARGGLKGGWDYKYSGSDNVDEIAWYVKNSDMKIHEVGTKKPNMAGLYDMSGNVWEWSWSDYNGFSNYRVYLGGGFNLGENQCIISSTNYNEPLFNINYLGFRICKGL